MPMKAQSLSAGAPQLVVDASFPGGNIIVEGYDGDVVLLRQDLRDTEGDWFYWCFRVTGAAGRALWFRFTGSNVIGVRGAAVSDDGGGSWRWLGAEAVSGSSFRYSFAPDIRDVRFCFTIPYMETNLRAFLDRFQGNPSLSVETLCQTQKGRAVEMLRVGRLDGSAGTRVLLTCRHHCCESMASYVLEGIMDAALGDSSEGRWLMEHAEILVVPFMDKDGVEDGDQGKNRRPHDHNRDYGGESLYPSVRALRELAPRWSHGRLHFALDLHCPHICGEGNEHIYFVGDRDPENWRRVETFSGILEEIQAGPIPFKVADNLPYGEAWNVEANYRSGKSFSQWASEIHGIRFASTVEVPYANASGAAVTPETARAFGRDLARAMARFLAAESPGTPGTPIS